MTLSQEHALRRKRILVTGAMGFVGSYIVPKLVELGAVVLATGRKKKSPFGKKVAYTTMEFTVPFLKKEVVKEFNPEFVLHLACPQDSPLNPETDRNFNLWACATNEFLLTLCELPKPPKVLILGSTKEYGNLPAPFRPEQITRPISAYGAAKSMVSDFAYYLFQAYKLKISILRLCSLYGPGQPKNTIIDAACRAVCEGTQLRMTEGRQIREFLYIEDAIQSILLALKLPITPESFILLAGSGEAISIRELIRMIFSIGNCKESIDPCTLPYRETEIFDMRVDSQLFSRLTQWSPRVSLRDGLKKTLEWYRGNVICIK